MVQKDILSIKGIVILKEIFTRLKKQNPKIDIKLVKKITSNTVKYHIIETFLARKELEKKRKKKNK
jgi:predicted SnoaL-like aldol condensation-catalyzing enzyme